MSIITCTVYLLLQCTFKSNLIVENRVKMEHYICKLLHKSKRDITHRRSLGTAIFAGFKENNDKESQRMLSCGNETPHSLESHS